MTAADDIREMMAEAFDSDEVPTRRAVVRRIVVGQMDPATGEASAAPAPADYLCRVIADYPRDRFSATAEQGLAVDHDTVRWLAEGLEIDPKPGDHLLIEEEGGPEFFTYGDDEIEAVKLPIAEVADLSAGARALWRVSA